jgi:hypothetical protein
MDMNWSELFSKPAALAPKDFECLFNYQNGAWTLSGVNLKQSDLAMLHTMPVFKLLCLEDPRLLLLVEPVERAYLKEESSKLVEVILEWVQPSLRNWCMRLLQEVMDTSASRLHPFLLTLWEGHRRWPYFIRSRQDGSPIQQFDNIFSHGCGYEQTILDKAMLQVLTALQYDQVNRFVFMTTVNAWAYSHRPDTRYRELFEPMSTPILRKWLVARKHLLSYVEMGSPLDPNILLLEQ